MLTKTAYNLILKDKHPESWRLRMLKNYINQLIPTWDWVLIINTWSFHFWQRRRNKEIHTASPC